MIPIVLATQSRYKIGLFEKLGLDFSTANPIFDEYEDPTQAPAELAISLAKGKALSLTSSYADHLIIGADQVLALGSEILHKPGTVEKAVEQLLRLSGKVHFLHTAYCVLESRTGLARCGVVSSEIRFWDQLDPDFLRELVLRDQTTDCVGAYKFESGGILLMEQVTMEDPNAIVGLPLMALARVLGEWGYFQNRFYKKGAR